MKKRISILGATGSVGRSTLDVIAAFPDRFEVVLLAAHRSREALLQQARRWRPRFVSIGARQDAEWLRARLGEASVVVAGADLERVIGDAGADLTVSAIVGAAGLKPTLAAIAAGSDIGLANKETMVVAGELVNRAARRRHVAILPIDSEHNALHQCLRGERREEVKRLILTASGGPFRNRIEDFAAITPEEALNHPTWDMGPKITIDSATMMNKGLEVIEAHCLFDFPPDCIDIVVHPQSLVHSMIETVDGSYKLQLSKTDMRDPIQYALSYPDRWPHPFESLDIAQGLTLDFQPVDHARFPCVALAYRALALGGAAPAALNAANEIAVPAFLQRRIKFTDIATLNQRCLERFGDRSGDSLAALMAVDAEVRAFAAKAIDNDMAGIAAALR